MGIRDYPTAPRSPWQNGHAERLIGSIRCECLDHIVVFGEAHLRRILAAYSSYYDEFRTPLYVVAQVLGAIAGAVASGKAGFDVHAGFASNGYDEHSPGGYSLAAGFVCKVG